MMVSNNRKRRCSIAPALVVGIAVVALAGCEQNGGGASAPVSATSAADTTLTCPQIVSDIGQQNSIISHASAQAKQGGQTDLQSNPTSPSADLGNPNSGSAALVPGGQQETPSQLAADRTGQAAVARANVLVTLGRQKKCFQ